MQTEVPGMGLVRPLRPGPVDVIGDVHGEIDPLRALLAQLQYRPDGSHAQGRRVVFVGDLTDRGPDSPAVGELAMDWVGRGVADCLLGNHELNLLRGDLKHGNSWFLDPDAPELQPGREFGHCRVADAAFRARYLPFLATLPVALERADLRVVHAAWVPGEIDALRGDRRTVLEVFDGYEERIASSLGMEGLVARARAERAEWHAQLHHRRSTVPLLPAVGELDERQQMGNPVRVATSGAERLASVPFWSAGKWRMVDRVPWWSEYDEAVPVIVGHYWRRLRPVGGSRHVSDKPNLFADLGPLEWMGPRRNVFCVDYSVGARYEERKSGKTAFDTRLMAMRWPERELWGEEGRVRAAPGR